jgi:hypothetical protein
MRRREFIGLPGGVAGALTCADRAEIADSSYRNPRHSSTPRLQIASPGATVLNRTRVACARRATLDRVGSADFVSDLHGPFRRAQHSGRYSQGWYA